MSLCILDGVVEQGCSDTLGVDGQLGENPRHGDGMLDERFARPTIDASVRRRRDAMSLADERQIVVVHILRTEGKQSSQTGRISHYGRYRLVVGLWLAHGSVAFASLIGQCVGAHPDSSTSASLASR